MSIDRSFEMAHIFDIHTQSCEGAYDGNVLRTDLNISKVSLNCERLYLVENRMDKREGEWEKHAHMSHLLFYLKTTT